MSLKLPQITELKRNLIARNSVLSLAQGIIGVSTYFVAMRYVIFNIGLEGVGLWALTVGATTFIRTFDVSGASGLAQVVARNTNDPKTQADIIDTMTIIVALFYSSICILGFLPMTYILLASIDSQLHSLAQHLLTLSLLWLPINIAGIAQLSAIDGMGRADLRSVINILGFILYGVLTAVLIPKYGLVSLAYAQIAQYCFTLFAARFLLVRKLKYLSWVPIGFSLEAAKICLSYGARLQLTSVPSMLLDASVRFFLGSLSGLEYLGIYDLSTKLVGNTRAILNAVLTPMVPEFTRLINRNVEDARASFAAAHRSFVFFNGIVFTCLLMSSPLVSLILLSDFNPTFMWSTAVLSLSWGIVTTMLPTHFYARANGSLRWGMCGQWTMLILLFISINWLSENLVAPWLVFFVVVPVLIGNIITFIGEARQFQLTQYILAGYKRSNALMLTFILTHVICIGFLTESIL